MSEPVWTSLSRALLEALGGWEKLAAQGVWWVRVDWCPESPGVVQYRDPGGYLYLMGSEADGVYPEQAVLDLEHPGNTGPLLSALADAVVEARVELRSAPRLAGGGVRASRPGGGGGGGADAGGGAGAAGGGGAHRETVARGGGR